MQLPEISVVIPVYNGFETLADVVTDVQVALEGHDFEILLVDDGSADRSWSLIEDLCIDARVRGLRLLKNYGQHAAVVAGLEASLGDWVVTIDDDGENDPAAILPLIGHAQDGNHDLVFAERTGRKGPLTRRISSKIVNRIVLRVFRAPDGITISNYRVLSRAVADRVASDATQYPYVNGLALEYSGSPASFPVAHSQHQGTGSRYTLSSLSGLLFDILFSYSMWAYRMVVGLTILTLLAGGSISLFAITRALLADDVVPGWASGVLLFSVMSGAILIALTVIGEYVVRTLRQARGPARYIVDSTA